MKKGMQGAQSLNKHIEDYLDYYCKLSSPEFAVLIKGGWGAGKTWFINRYRESLEREGQDCVYVSLYGMTSFSDIEYAFFQQLHPRLSSKEIALVSKLLKGFLKGTLKLDFDNDGSQDGTLTVQIPDLNISENLKNVNKRILIFDDLERCKININDLLGYINSFVEHHGLRVILIAHEDVLVKNKETSENDIDDYNLIKEKLIGQIFNISLDFEGALENFIKTAEISYVREFLSENVELIQDLYQGAACENLRSLKQVILYFERIFKELPDSVKNRPDILQDILKFLVVLCIEIKRGDLLSKNIGTIPEQYIRMISDRLASNKLSNSSSSNETKKEEKEVLLEKIINKYPNLNFYELFPSAFWWQTYFDKGFIDKVELEQSILSSKYFQDKNTPSWIKLYHFTELSNEQFDDLIKEVELEYNNKNFIEIGELKHVVGLFLLFSDAGIYPKSRSEILNSAKSYVDHLRNEKLLSVNSSPTYEALPDSYRSLGFQGRDFEEFKAFSSYINEAHALATVERMNNIGQDVLTIIDNDIRKFREMICLVDSVYDEEEVPICYYDSPILIHINLNDFAKKIFSINFEDQQYIFSSLDKRYRFEDVNKKLIKELDWLEHFQILLLEEAERQAEKLSGFLLKLLNKTYLKGIIQRLRQRKKNMEMDE